MISSSKDIHFYHHDLIYAPINIGHVLDQNGHPVANASILVKDTKIGRITDTTGVFSLELPEWKNVLTVTAVGYNPLERTVDSSVIHIVLTRIDTKLEEIVVTAFGQRQRKSDLVSAVSTLSPKELRAPVSNLTSALQAAL